MTSSQGCRSPGPAPAISLSNCGAAIAPGATAAVADLTTTVFCDSSGVRIIVLARDWARTDNVELRLVVPPGPALVVMRLVGLDQVLPIYPSLDEALGGESQHDLARAG